MRSSRPRALLLLFAIVTTALANPVAHADPCGMVPPFQLKFGAPELLRVGDQITFVFFKDGVQDIVLRPGFRGSVDEFGMLIPFPAVPEIRKVPDEIFQHVVKALDPPEVVIDLRPRYALSKGISQRAKREMDRDELDILIANEVQVVREEAVGMYQVAVLRATDPRALRLWMETHQYVYPAGMDEVCREYIEEEWCFVAVKADVGQKSGVTPRPGMRAADATRPEGSSFEGAVQAMGFRFHVPSPVVPMRLSAFNPGDIHNTVYLLADHGSRIVELDKDFVTRQMSGEELFRNITEPLPVKVIGGTLEDAEKQGVLQHYDRDPSRHNGFALDLFASDLLAVREHRLAHPFENREKELLKIGERLGLRGTEVDALIAEVISEERTGASGSVLEDLKKMTLTVIDGDFPRDVIAKQNLTFDRFVAQVTREKNTLLALDAEPEHDSSDGLALAIIGLLFAGAIVTTRISRSGVFAAVAVLALLVTAVANADRMVERPTAIAPLINDLENPDKAEVASAELIALGAKVLPDLIHHASFGSSVAGRGWAIVSLADIGDGDAVEPLKKIMSNEGETSLVKMWAGAAVTRLKGVDGIRDLLTEQLADYGKRGSVAAILLGMRGGAVRPLVTISLTDENTQIRQTATAYLGALDQRLRGGLVRKVYREALRYTPEAAENGAPWKGGALFLPGYQWTKEDAFDTTVELVCWLLWCESNGDAEIAKQLQNNLRDLSWRNGIGFQNQATALDWVRLLVKARGRTMFRITDETPRDTLLVILDLLRDR